MCGRYSNSKDLSELPIEFNNPIFFSPRYNIAPRQQAPVLIKQGKIEARMMRWGLIPAWAKEEGAQPINARSETLQEKPSFRRAFDGRRCLVPADGFFEWQKRGTGKTPFRFVMKKGGLFCLAGLWEKWIRPAQHDLFEEEPKILETFTIITTEANAMVKAVHDRMPVILHPEHYGWWLDEGRKGEDVQALLRPFPAEWMDCYQVSALVNNARFDGPECVELG